MHQLPLVSPLPSCSIAFFSSVIKSKYFTLFSFSLIFVLWSTGTAKSTIRQVLFFIFLFYIFIYSFILLIITRSGRLAGIRGSVCTSKSQRILRVPFSRWDSGLCTYHLFVWSNFNFLHNSQWITFPTQLCLVSYFLCASFLHLLIM